MTKINAGEVQQALKESLYHEEELNEEELNGDQPPEGAVLVNGLVNRFGFHPSRLETQRDKVKSWLDALPETFRQSKGGGWSFLNACHQQDGVQWGEHRDMEALFCLAIGLKLATWQPTERELWSAFPGGVPYVVILDESQS